MKRLNKHGISLAEVLAVIVITGIISSLTALFIAQASKTIATHKANNNLITEVSFVFREIEKEIDNKTFKPADYEGDTPKNITKIDKGNGQFKYMISLDGLLFPSHPSVEFSNITFAKDVDASKNPEFNLYVMEITSKTIDNDSVDLEKTYKTSFLIRK